MSNSGCRVAGVRQSPASRAGPSSAPHAGRAVRPPRPAATAVVLPAASPGPHIGDTLSEGQRPVFLLCGARSCAVIPGPVAAAGALLSRTIEGRRRARRGPALPDAAIFGRAGGSSAVLLLGLLAQRARPIGLISVAPEPPPSWRATHRAGGRRCGRWLNRGCWLVGDPTVRPLGERKHRQRLYTGGGQQAGDLGGSNGGATSTMSMPTRSSPARPRTSVTSWRLVSPPTSGVPVPGA